MYAACASFPGVAEAPSPLANVMSLPLKRWQSVQLKSLCQAELSSSFWMYLWHGTQSISFEEVSMFMNVCCSEKSENTFVLVNRRTSDTSPTKSIAKVIGLILSPPYKVWNCSK